VQTRDSEPPSLKSLIDQTKAAIVPVEDFEGGPSSIVEDKDIPIQRVPFQVRSDHTGQGVDGLPEVLRLGSQKHTDCGRDGNHADSITATRRAIPCQCQRGHRTRSSLIRTEWLGSGLLPTHGASTPANLRADGDRDELG